MTVKDIFDLRKQGHIEEAYNAIRPMYRVHPGHYTTICMYHCARDIFNLRLRQGRTEEARKIFLALQKLVPFLSDRDGRVSAFMQYASSRLDGLSRMSPLDGDLEATVPDGSPSGKEECPAVLPQGNGVPYASSLVSSFYDAPASSLVSPLDGDPEPKLQRLLDVLKGPMSVREMMAALGFGSRDKFLKNYLSPALKSGLIEMTNPDSPKSPKQRYRKAKGDK